MAVGISWDPSKTMTLGVSGAQSMIVNLGVAWDPHFDRGRRPVLELTENECRSVLSLTDSGCRSILGPTLRSWL